MLWDTLPIPTLLPPRRLSNVLRAVVAAGIPLAFPAAGFAHGDLHEQIEVITRELLTAPLDGALYFRRAELHRAHEEWAEAVKDYGEAEALAVQPQAVRLGRAKALQGWRRLTQARADLDWLVERVPNHVEALVTRARVRAALEDHVGSSEDFSRAIVASAAAEPEYYLERATALRSAQPPRLEEALGGLDQGILRLGPLVTLTLAALEIEVERGDYEAALRRIDRALQAARRREQWLCRRAAVLEKAGRRDEARASCDEAIQAITTLPPRLRFLPATATLEQEINRLRQKLDRSPAPNPVTK